GLNATPLTLLPARRGALARLPVAGSQIRMVPSPSALASNLPSGLNATPFTPPAELARRGGPAGLPVARLPIPTVPSPEAPDKSLPSGLKATAFAPDEMATREICGAAASCAEIPAAATAATVRARQPAIIAYRRCTVWG